MGALAALLGIELAEVEKLIAEQYKGKEKLLEPNVKALHLGRDYALAHLPCPLGITVKRSDKVGDKIFIEGNNAAALPSIGRVCGVTAMNHRRCACRFSSPVFRS